MKGLLLDVLPTCAALLYIAWSVPFRIAFLEHFSYDRKYLFWWSLDYAADAYFLLHQSASKRSLFLGSKGRSFREG